MKELKINADSENRPCGETETKRTGVSVSESEKIASAPDFGKTAFAAWLDLRMALFMTAWVLAYVVWAALSTLCGNINPWRLFWIAARCEWHTAMQVRRAWRAFPSFADVGADARLRDAVEGYRKLREEARKWEL